jgi:predicted dehydrogenase
MNSANLRIAVVGVGQVAVGNFLPTLRDEKDVVLSVYNRTSAKAQAAAKSFNAEYLESLEAVAKWNPASVIVTTNETYPADEARPSV